MGNLATYKGLGSPVFDVEFLPTNSSRLTLTADQQSKLLISGGDARQIRLPAPEVGMVYNVFFSSGGVSTATKITSSGAYDILCGGSTAKGVANASTVEMGVWIQLVAINSFRWVASRLGGSTLQVQSTST